MNTQANIATQGLKTVISSCLLILLLATKLQAAEFDHQYTAYDALLKEVVKVSENKKQTRVDYQRLAIHPESIAKILQVFSAVTQTQYDSWATEQKLSFLINAYNGFTMQLIVNNWSQFKLGEASSIRDLGSLFTSAWEKKFFTLLGKKHNLDDIEHEMIRKWFKEPRIHAALVCAAVSCPPLRDEAFVAEQLSEQLENQMELFLADNSRNEIIIAKHRGQAYLSSIFSWYRGDFEKGEGGFNSLYDVLNKYSEAIVKGDKDEQAQRNVLKGNDFPILFKDYDWRLNDVANF
ncbi:DUF547 domain-containing protein [Paraglaciecola sp. 25GB23A]|uniref:DUF547 domain-containing protein n=1 Tax=Paraglaciecola sp. 25GB23A TaxID=3156068 RepID=UPI0032AF0829